MSFPPGTPPRGGVTARSVPAPTLSDSLYPVLLKLAGRTVVVVGGGQVAARKVEGLLASGARVVVVAPRAGETITELAEQGDVGWIVRGFRAADLDEAQLVVAATGDPDLNAVIADAARERNLLVNAVDDPERCDFFLPAVVRRGELVVSVSTSGASPALARELARELGRSLPGSLADYVGLLADARGAILRRYPTEPGRRRRLCEALITSAAREACEAGELEFARAMLGQIVKDEDPPHGGSTGGRR